MDLRMGSLLYLQNQLLSKLRFRSTASMGQNKRSNDGRSPWNHYYRNVHSISDSQSFMGQNKRNKSLKRHGAHVHGCGRRAFRIVRLRFVEHAFVRLGGSNSMTWCFTPKMRSLWSEKSGNSAWWFVFEKRSKAVNGTINTFVLFENCDVTTMHICKISFTVQI